MLAGLYLLFINSQNFSELLVILALQIHHPSTMLEPQVYSQITYTMITFQRFLHSVPYHLHELSWPYCDICGESSPKGLFRIYSGWIIVTHPWYHWLHSASRHRLRLLPWTNPRITAPSISFLSVFQGRESWVWKWMQHDTIPNSKEETYQNILNHIKTY